MIRKFVILFGVLFFAISGNSALAADTNSANANPANGNAANDLECPVGLVNGLDLDSEFGPGTSDVTRCLGNRNAAKVVMQVNQFCRDSVPNAECTRPFALGNIDNMIKDYETTHGMQQGEDFEIVAVVHSGGGALLLKESTGRNQFEGKVRNLIERGVKFYFCQNTTRGFIRKGILPAGDATAQLIEGVGYVTAGVTAIADFQQQGYHYVQP